MTVTVVLDYTLADLYSIDGDASNLVLVFAYPSSPTQFSTFKKFPYQSPLKPKEDEKVSILRRLHNLPLKLSLVAGKLPLLLLDPVANGGAASGPGDTLRRFHTDAIEILRQLHPDQRPDLSFIPSIEDVKLQPNSKLVVLSPLDRLAHLPHSIDPEIHYDLLSKRGLAYSGLPTPETYVIDTTIDARNTYLPQQLDEEVHRMLNRICNRDLPFVIKVPQGIASLGTFIVQTETERQRAKSVLQVELRQMLQDVNELNYHLHPCSLVIQELIPSESVALSFFLTQQGRAIFICCSTQFFNEQGIWAGGSICYTEQPKLEKQYALVMSQISGFLHSNAYYGAVGADIVTDLNGRHLVVDLNIRVTGTYNLGCLKGHFEGRGLSHALLYQFKPRSTQRGFRRGFQKEMENGSLIICSWTSLPDGSSMASIIIAAPDQHQLKVFLAKVKALVPKLHCESCTAP